MRNQTQHKEFTKPQKFVRFSVVAVMCPHVRIGFDGIYLVDCLQILVRPHVASCWARPRGRKCVVSNTLSTISKCYIAEYREHCVVGEHCFHNTTQLNASGRISCMWGGCNFVAVVHASWKPPFMVNSLHSFEGQRPKGIVAGHSIPNCR